MGGVLESKRKRVVVVEDDEWERHVVVRALEREGFDVAEAASAEEAFALLAREQTHLVLTDLQLPGLSGIEVLRRAKSTCRDTEVVVITGVASTDSAIEALREGAFDYIRKPIAKIDELVRRVRQALMQRSLRLHNRQLRHKLREMHEELRKVAVSRTRELGERTGRFQRLLAQAHQETECAQDAVAAVMEEVTAATRAIDELARDAAARASADSRDCERLRELAKTLAGAVARLPAAAEAGPDAAAA